MRGNTDAQEEKDQLYPATNWGVGKSLLRHQVPGHLPQREAGGSDRFTRVQDSGSVPTFAHETFKTKLFRRLTNNIDCEI